MTKFIARVHPVHLMNADWAPGGRQPSDQGCESAENWQLSSTSTIAFVCSPTKGARLSQPSHCSRGVQPMPKAVYRSSCRDKHNCLKCDSNLGPLTLQSDVLTTRLLRPVMCVMCKSTCEILPLEWVTWPDVCKLIGQESRGTPTGSIYWLTQNTDPVLVVVLHHCVLHTNKLLQ